MLAQLITAIGTGIGNGMTNLIQNWNGNKFYFISLLVFLLGIGIVFREPITILVQGTIFNEIQFRECRDLIGLKKGFDTILTKDTIVSKYVVYLYQPTEKSTYKRAVLTNSEVIMNAPSLQGMYLKDQPTINRELTEHSYYITNKEEALKHPDLQYLIDISDHYRLFYALKYNGKILGEIAVRFKQPPTIVQIETVLKDLSPLLRNYII